MRCPTPGCWGPGPNLAASASFYRRCRICHALAGPAPRDQAARRLTSAVLLPVTDHPAIGQVEEVLVDVFGRIRDELDDLRAGDVVTTRMHSERVEALHDVIRRQREALAREGGIS